MSNQRRTGQIIQKGPGKYLVRAYRGRDSAGKRRYASRTVKGSKRDAAAALRELEGARDRGLSADGLSLTLNAYLDRWLRDVAPLRWWLASRGRADVGRGQGLGMAAVRVGIAVCWLQRPAGY